MNDPIADRLDAALNQPADISSAAPRSDELIRPDAAPGIDEFIRQDSDADPELAEVKACRDYPGLSNARRITFEYVMLKGVNDSAADAKQLVRLMSGIPAKINLIPFNPWPGAPYECSEWEQIEAFGEIVNRAGYASPIRTPRGRDIMAACGQLKSDSVKERASAKLAELRSRELAGMPS